MKKYFLYILFFTFIFSACEKDDICLSPTTPSLVLRFYDATNPSITKTPLNLSIWAEGKDTLTRYKSVTLDSVYIPLNTNTTQTKYHFKTSATGNIADNIINSLTLNYITEDVFVSRSCGLKTVFKEVTITSDNGWFQSYSPNSITIIDNEDNAHINIYH